MATSKITYWSISKDIIAVQLSMGIFEEEWIGDIYWVHEISVNLDMIGSKNKIIGGPHAHASFDTLAEARKYFDKRKRQLKRDISTPWEERKIGF